MPYYQRRSQRAQMIRLNSNDPQNRTSDTGPVGPVVIGPLLAPLSKLTLMENQVKKFHQS